MAVVAVGIASGFEQTELTVFLRELNAAGHATRLVSTKKQMARSWDNMRWNGDIPVDVAVGDARADDFAALVLPGGLIAADTLRADPPMVRLAADLAARGKPVAAMGHAVWVAIEAGLMPGRRATSHPAIRTDVTNAGGIWADEAAVVDGPLVTGRHVHDAVEFVSAVARSLAAASAH